LITYIFIFQKSHHCSSLPARLFPHSLLIKILQSVQHKHIKKTLYLAGFDCFLRLFAVFILNYEASKVNLPFENGTPAANGVCS